MDDAHEACEVMSGMSKAGFCHLRIEAVTVGIVWRFEKDALECLHEVLSVCARIKTINDLFFFSQ